MHSYLRKNFLKAAGHLNRSPLSMDEVRIGVAGIHDISCAVLATTALRCNTQINLDVFKAFALQGVLLNYLVRNAVADANDHDGR